METTYADLRNQTDLLFLDISSERERTYTQAGFPGGKFTVQKPVALNVSESGGHRILDASGTSHYVQPKEGWAISWEAYSNAPHFVK